MPTSVFCCGFEEGVFGPHWTAGASVPTFETSSPISGLRSLRCTVTAGQTNRNAVSVASFGAGLIVARFRVRFTSLPSVGGSLLHLAGNTGTGVLMTGGLISAQANNFSQGPAVSVVAGIVYTIDVKIDRRADPWKTDVQVNGIPCGQAVSATAADISAQQLVIGQQQGLGISQTMDVLFDDVVVSTTEADYPIGPGFVHPFIPAADGTHNVAGADDFERGNTGTDITNATTTAFQLIDDVPMKSAESATDNIQATAPPNATDYVEVVFGPASGISTPTVAPRGVEAIVAHHQVATQSGNIRLALNDNGSLDDVLNLTAAGVTTIRYARKHYADPPSAASAWTLSGNGNFNNLRMRMFSSDAAPDQCWDGAMIEAEFDGPLLTKQTLANGTDIIVAEDLVASPPTSYEVSDSITETASSVVTTTVFNETTEGETPQQQCVIESNGGDDTGTTIVNPGQHVFVRVQVTGANTDVGLSGVSNP